MPTDSEGHAAAARASELTILKRDSVRGGLINAAAQAAGIGIQLVSTVVLARLLSPAEFGIVAMVTAVTAFARLFRDLGLSSATIQAKELTPHQQSNLFWINMAMGGVLTTIVAASAPLVVWAYGEPSVFGVTLAMSSTFLIGSLGAQHSASLIRGLRFDRLAVASVSGSLVTLGVSAFLALAGWSYWSLVWGAISGAVVTTVLLWALSPLRVLLPRRGAGLRAILGFGASVTAFDIVNYLHRNLDKILIGNVWGAESLGFYGRAYALMMSPIHAIRGPIQTVAFPTLSRLQDDPVRYRKAASTVAGAAGLLGAPILILMGLLATDGIPFVLGPQWEPLVEIFIALLPAAYVALFGGIRGSIWLSLGKTREYLWLGVVNALLCSLAFLIAVPFGTTAVAAAYSGALLLSQTVSILVLCERTHIEAADLVPPMIAPLVIGVVSAIAIYPVTVAVADHPIGWQLTIASLSFVAVYPSLCFVADKACGLGLADLLDLIRRSTLAK